MEKNNAPPQHSQLVLAHVKRKVLGQKLAALPCRARNLQLCKEIRLEFAEAVERRRAVHELACVVNAKDGASRDVEPLHHRVP